MAQESFYAQTGVLPRVIMLRFVEIAVGDKQQMREANIVEDASRFAISHAQREFIP